MAKPNHSRADVKFSIIDPLHDIDYYLVINNYLEFGIFLITPNNIKSCA